MEKLVDQIEKSAQLAALLEVSGKPKPGNVHRNQDFPDTKYEHFLASSVALGKTMRKSAQKGIKISEGEIKTSNSELGSLIKEGIENTQNSHTGGNTHLGTILLFTPISIAAGKTLHENQTFKLKPLRKNFDQIMKSTTVQDSLETYEAIRQAMDLEKNGESWLGTLEKSELSILNPKTKDRLAEEKMNLYDWMKVSSEYDNISKELTNKIKTCSKGSRIFKRILKEREDVNIATVHTFLKILSRNPDTFIARKNGLKKNKDIKKAVEEGMKKAQEVSKKAGETLEAGGLTTSEGKRKIQELDEELQKEKGELNPGTTADITATAIFLALLSGQKL